MNIEKRVNKLLDEVRSIGEIATEEKPREGWYNTWGYFAVIQKVVKMRLDGLTATSYDPLEDKIRIQRMEEKIRYYVSIGRNGHAFALFGIYLGVLQKLDQI